MKATPRFTAMTLFGILLGLRVDFDQDVRVDPWADPPAWLGNGTVPCSGLGEDGSVYFDAVLSQPATITIPENDPYALAGVYPVET